MNKVNTTQLLRGLTGISLVIFLLPFLNMCSEDTMNSENADVLKRIERSKNFEFREDHNMKDEYNRNAYQLAYWTIEDLKASNLSQPFFYACLCYVIIIVSSAFMFYQSFQAGHELIKYLNLFNLFLLLLSTLIFYSEEIITSIDQIKFGFYLYLFDIFLIHLVSMKVKGNKTEKEVLQT